MGLRRRTAAGTVLLTVVLSGCGSDEPGTPPEVTVDVSGRSVALEPTQYCLDDAGRRYDTVPPIIEVSPEAAITFTVPDDVAEQGWSVQVFDERLEEKIGEVDVDRGAAVFDDISTSDVAPAAFYLVVVEDKGEDCGGFSGAWPVGFIRASGEPPSSATPSG